VSLTACGLLRTGGRGCRAAYGVRAGAGPCAPGRLGIAESGDRLVRAEVAGWGIRRVGRTVPGSRVAARSDVGRGVDRGGGTGTEAAGQICDSGGKVQGCVREPEPEWHFEWQTGAGGRLSQRAGASDS
jgi:hypothetical protein